MDKNNDIKFQNKKLDWHAPALINLSEQNLYGGVCMAGDAYGQNCSAGTSAGTGGTSNTCSRGVQASPYCLNGQAVS